MQDLTAHPHDFQGLWVGSKAERWLNEMPKDKTSGDNTALWALCHSLRRPVVGWRDDVPDQPPTALMPRILAKEGPIYLLHCGSSEHYSALVPSAGN